MARVNKIVTSEIDGSNLSQSDPVGDRTYAYDADGRISYYGSNRILPVIEPGIVYGANKDSSDGQRFNTIKLYPHAPLGGVPDDDRYLIIDPTFPNHIHIRPGGTIDQSNAELILGGERNFVKIDDGSRVVVISSKEPQSVQAVLNVNSESNEYMIFNDVVPVSSNGWYTEVNGIKYYVANVTYPTEGQTEIYVPGATFQPQGVYNMFSPEISSQWQFDGEGIVYGPGDGAETTFTRIATINSDGTGQNVKIGDDAWIGDVNIANHVAIIGQQDSLEGGILLGERLGEKIYTDGDSLTIEAAQGMTLNAVGGDMNFYMDGAAYIGPSTAINRIAQIKDLNDYQNAIGGVVSYSPTWSGTGLTFNGTPATGSYIKIGKLVQVQVDVLFTDVTNFGTGQYSITLPINSAYHTDVYGGSIHNTGPTTDHYSIKGHLSPGSNVATLWFISGSSQDQVFDHNSPITLNTTDKFHLSFSYICE